VNIYKGILTRNKNRDRARDHQIHFMTTASDKKWK